MEPSRRRSRYVRRLTEITAGGLVVTATRRVKPPRGCAPVYPLVSLPPSGGCQASQARSSMNRAKKLSFAGNWAPQRLLQAAWGRNPHPKPAFYLSPAISWGCKWPAGQLNHATPPLSLGVVADPGNLKISPTGRGEKLEGLFSSWNAARTLQGGTGLQLCPPAGILFRTVDSSRTPPEPRCELGELSSAPPA